MLAVPISIERESTVYELYEFLTASITSIRVLLPIAKPIRSPASERDFENVPVTSRFSYFSISETLDVPPKSTYASSIITTLSLL